MLVVDRGGPDDAAEDRGDAGAYAGETVMTPRKKRANKDRVIS